MNADVTRLEYLEIRLDDGTVEFDRRASDYLECMFDADWVIVRETCGVDMHQTAFPASTVTAIYTTYLGTELPAPTGEPQ